VVTPSLSVISRCSRVRFTGVGFRHFSGWDAQYPHNEFRAGIQALLGLVFLCPFCALRGAACSASITKTNIILVLYYACTRVNWPIIDRLLMIEHFGRSLSILLHFEWLIFFYRSVFSSFTNHFKNEKPRDQPKSSCKENTFSQIVKCVFFHFSLFWPLLFSNFIIFLFLIHLK